MWDLAGLWLCAGGDFDFDPESPDGDGGGHEYCKLEKMDSKEELLVCDLGVFFPR